MRAGRWDVDALWFVIAAAICIGAPFNDGTNRSQSVAGEIIATACVVVIGACLWIVYRRRKR